MTVLLALEAVTVRRAERCVLHSASFSVTKGQRIGVVGPNGAGKTTLLRTLVGLERPESGRVLAFGAERRTERDFREVRVRAGLLFQDPDDQLFCPTVVDDIAFGPLNLGRAEAAAYDMARTLLGRFGLGHLEDRITHRLSDGEKRLVSLAAVLAMEPEVLLLDEPTNALDDHHRDRLIAILAGLDRTMVIVSHDRPFLQRLATDAVQLHEGRLEPASP
ncbi:MAG: ABC transporter ATP-binding protein [Rhodospirillaceae bacterium]|nr:ABC transporter ATP-binding protein [Rhodospirillaceae bacterium]